jgi:hypothetical protein
VQCLLEPAGPHTGTHWAPGHSPRPFHGAGDHLVYQCNSMDPGVVPVVSLLCMRTLPVFLILL